MLCWMPALGQISGKTYFGFDRNEYPGDNLLPALHRSFSYAGYWQWLDRQASHPQGQRIRLHDPV
jgi:hypothetical protein